MDGGERSRNPFPAQAIEERGIVLNIFRIVKVCETTRRDFAVGKQAGEEKSRRADEFQRPRRHESPREDITWDHRRSRISRNGDRRGRDSAIPGGRDATVLPPLPTHGRDLRRGSLGSATDTAAAIAPVSVAMPPSAGEALRDRRTPPAAGRGPGSTHVCPCRAPLSCPPPQQSHPRVSYSPLARPAHVPLPPSHVPRVPVRVRAYRGHTCAARPGTSRIHSGGSPEQALSDLAVVLRLLAMADNQSVRLLAANRRAETEGPGPETGVAATAKRSPESS